MDDVRRASPILLAHSYYLRYDEKQVRRMKPYPPLATLYVASHLRDQGYAVALFDAMLADGVEAFHRTLRATRPAIVAIIEDNFNFLTKMCTVRMREAALEMIRAARRAGCRIAVNGSDASDQPELYLAAGADAVVIGEPEHAFADLVRAWTDPHGGDIDRVPGLYLPARAEGGAPRRTEVRPVIDDLDALPFPAWDLVDVPRYRDAWTSRHGRISWNVVTSRGCPYRCNWCAKPLFGTRYAQRSPADVAEELRQLRHEVAPDHVWFADDIFGLTARWVQQFADEVAARDARIPFTMQSRANLMQPDVVAALASAGAEDVWLGVESGSQRILDAMDKGTTVQEIRAATRTLRAHGIRACWFIQLGYLGETWEDLLLTRDLIRAERPDEIGVSVAYPLPGTRFHDIVKEQLGAKTNWEDSDELAMMFHGTYTTAFYREVRAALHAEVTAADDAGRMDARWNDLAAARHHHRSALSVQPVA